MPRFRAIPTSNGLEELDYFTKLNVSQAFEPDHFFFILFTVCGMLENMWYYTVRQFVYSIGFFSYAPVNLSR